MSNISLKLAHLLVHLDVNVDAGKRYGRPLAGDARGHVRGADLVSNLQTLMATNENARASKYFADAMQLCLLVTNLRDSARIERLEADLGAKELALNDALGALALSSRDDVEDALRELESNKERLANFEQLVESMKAEIEAKDARIEEMKEKQLEIGRVTVERDRARRDVAQLETKLEHATTLLNAKSAELERSEAFRHDAIATLERQASKAGATKVAGWEFNFCSTNQQPPPPDHATYDLSGTPFEGIDTIHERAVFE